MSNGRNFGLWRLLLNFYSRFCCFFWRFVATGRLDWRNYDSRYVSLSLRLRLLLRFKAVYVRLTKRQWIDERRRFGAQFRLG